jgi:hypothetical protein
MDLHEAADVGCLPEDDILASALQYQGQYEQAEEMN